jgi:heme A synthase
MGEPLSNHELGLSQPFREHRQRVLSAALGAIILGLLTAAWTTDGLVPGFLLAAGIALLLFCLVEFSARFLERRKRVR